MDVAEWLNDYLEIDPKTGKSKKDFLDLIIKVGIDLIKVFVGIALGIAAMAVTIFLATLAAAYVGITLVISGTVLIVGTLIFSVVIGEGINSLDDKNGISKFITEKLRKTYDYLEQRMPIDYKGYKSAMESIF